MIRITFELLPGGDASRSRIIGLMEIANVGLRPGGFADYAVALKKTPPFSGALKAAWKTGKLSTHNVYGEECVSSIEKNDDNELITTQVEGHHRTRRGVYDLTYRALVACGLAARNP